MSKEPIEANESQHDAAGEKDQFGNLKYDPKFLSDVAEKMSSFAFPSVGPAASARVDLPWNVRNVPIEDHTTWLSQLKSVYFWNKFDNAFRGTLIGLLPPAILIAAASTRPSFVSASIATMGGLIGSAGFFGMSIAIVLQFFKAACFWLPFCTAMIAGRLWEHEVAWNFVYAFGCFFICTFSTNFTKRLCLIGFNISMLSQFSIPGRSITFPSHLMADFCVGFSFGILSTLIPFPKRCGMVADRFMATACTSMSEAVVSSRLAFFAPNLVERTFAFARLRCDRRVVEDNLSRLPLILQGCEYEFVFGVEAMTFRRHKYFFLQNFAKKVSSLVRSIEVLSENPALISESSKRSKEFIRRLEEPTLHMFSMLGEAIRHIGQSTDRSNSRQHERLAALRQSLHEFEHVFHQMRREIFHETLFVTIDPVVSVVAYYVFCVRILVESLEDFYVKIIDDPEPKSANWPCLRTVVLNFLLQPIIDEIREVKALLFEFGEKERRIVVEAVKAAGAMIASVRFFVFMNPLTAYVSGPTVLAFCVSENAGDAINVSILRLGGTMFGAVIGFFGDSYAETVLQKVATLCTIIFVSHWFRDGKKYGGVAFFAGFVALSMITLTTIDTSPAAVVLRIQQNTFAIIIYMLIAVFVYPAKPLQLVREQRCRIYDALKATVASTMHLFSIDILDKPTSMKAIDIACANVTKLRAELAAEQVLLRPAEEEPLLHFATYPTETSSIMSRAEERLCGILETAVRSWRFLVTTDDVSHEDFHNLVGSLAPVAEDIAQSFASCMNVLKTVVVDPFADVVHDQVETTTQFFLLTRELGSRKTNGFVAMIEAAQKRNGIATTMEYVTPAESPTSAVSSDDHSAIGDVGSGFSPWGRKVRFLRHDQDIPIGMRHAEGLHSICFCASLLAPELRTLMIAAGEMHQFDNLVS